MDPWARWLLHDRHGGDTERLRTTLAGLTPIRDRVLANAAVAEGDVVLDVGTGTGLIAFAALELVGQTGRVIFLDASQALLDHCRTLAGELGVLDRCDFVRASADDLSPIGDASVDVVTTRSVVMYQPAKERAFRALHRVLRPGGRASLYERINRFGFPEPPHRFWGYDVTPVHDLVQRVRVLVEPSDLDVLLDFDERDLLAWAEHAGFAELHLELHATVTPHGRGDWDALLHGAQPPPGTSLSEAIERALAPDEAARFAAHLRPLVEAGQGTRRWAAAYLWARKH